MTREGGAKSTSLVQTGHKMGDHPGRSDLEQVFRRERAGVLAALVRAAGDFELAEDALQDAFVAALDVWPREGMPQSPGAWLTTVARNRAMSVWRHRAVIDTASEEVRERACAMDARLDGDEVSDDRLRLIFCACHPALSDEARVALALQTICGLSTAAVARLFLVSEATIAQRLVRAKRKIRDAGIPFAVPSGDDFDSRLGAVCCVAYLLFTEGYSPSDGDLGRSAPLCEEAIRLGRVICSLLPVQPEPRGLLALMLLHDARRAARTDASGELVSMEDQDRRSWDREAIAEGTRYLEQALSRGKPGPYQVQAAIAALHAEAKTAAATDWVQIMALYEELWQRAPSPSVALGLVVAEAMAFAPEPALVRLQRFDRAGALAGSHRVASVRAELLGRAGRWSEALVAYDAAVASSRNEREARLLGRHRDRWGRRAARSADSAAQDRLLGP